MIDKFYYFGIGCIVYELFHLFYPDDDSIQSKHNESFLKFILKRWVEVLLGITYLSWIIIGAVLFSNERQLFIGLFTLTITFPFIIYSLVDTKVQRRVSQLSNILTILIIALIEYVYFIKPN